MKKLILAASVLCALATGSGVAQAGFNTCNGYPMIWRGPLTVTRNRCSIPDTGIVNTAYWNGVRQWNDFAGEVDSFQVRPGTDCGWDSWDGVNEISLVNQSEIDGALGTTIVNFGPCVIGPNDIDEADMLIANNLNFVVRAGHILGTGGRDTFVHEFGHFFGLQHSPLHSVMRANPPLAVTGGGTEAASIWPADAALLDSAYGFWTPGSDLVVSAQGVVGGASGSLVNLDPATTVTACRGSTVTTKFYVGNLGNVGVSTFNFRILMNINSPPTGYTTGGIVVGNHTWNNFPAFGEVTFNLSFTVPSTVGFNTYSIYYQLDPANSVGELREWNNATVSVKKVFVNC